MKDKALHRRARQRPRSRGVTLVEVLVVVTIMALIAGAVTILVFPQMQRARIKKAIVDAKTIRGAVELHRSVDGDGRCVGVDELVQAEKLDGDNTSDPWGSTYQVVCDGAKVRVFSPGRDQQAGTADDVWNYFKAEDVERLMEL